MRNDTLVTERPRPGQWFQTYSGRSFWPLDPRPEDIDIEDIAHALSLLCRFNGHTIDFYSVAQHSVLVSRIVPAEDALWGLLHDAAEAYVGDVVKPLKVSLTTFNDIEKDIERVIAEKYHLPLPMPKTVKHADGVLLATERLDLLPIQRPWPFVAEPLPYRIRPWDPRSAETAFMRRFKELKQDRERARLKTVTTHG